MRFAMVFAVLVFIAQGAQAQQACDVWNQDTCDDDLLTAGECLSAFEDSSARPTCIAPSAKVESDDRCKVRAGCRKRNFQDWKWSNITVRHARVHDLRNCDGTLKLGRC